MLPFGESLSLILNEAFNDIGYDAYYTYDLGKNIYSDPDDIVLFVMPPERYVDGYVDKDIGKGKRILWNLEPISHDPPDGYMTEKYVRRKEVMADLFYHNAPSLDAVWLYDKTQYDYFNHPKAVYVPLGVAKCLVKNVKKTCEKRRRVVFVGSATGARKRFIQVVHGKIAKKKRNRVKFIMHGYKKFENTDILLKRISQLNIGLDIRSHEKIHRYVRWHRIMMYAACRIVLVSDTDLSPYGFKHRRDYYYFQNAAECIEILEKLMGEKDTAKNVANNMFNKVFEHHQMKDILKGALNEHN